MNLTAATILCLNFSVVILILCNMEYIHSTVDVWNLCCPAVALNLRILSVISTGKISVST